jgi:hypothetical protein
MASAQFLRSPDAQQTEIRGDRVGIAGTSVPIVERADVLVVGGGPAGVAAAVAAAREGLEVTLVERYPFLGGMASGGMVLVLDDMANGAEITVRGIVEEYVRRLERIGGAVYPPQSDWGQREDALLRWSRWGFTEFGSTEKPKPIVHGVSFDPEAWKSVSNDLIGEHGISLRLHHWFSSSIVEGNEVKGIICESKAGRQAIMGKVVVDATGDGDVAASAGADYLFGTFKVTPVFRLGGVDIEQAIRFERENPEEAKEVDRRIRRVLGGAWSKWWLRTTLPGIVWCNCPHIAGIDTTDPLQLTDGEVRGRKIIANVVAHARENVPGFGNCYLVDVAPQFGVRQSRLIAGEYVVTKEDIDRRRHFHDSVARGRGYYTPYRALVPRAVEGLLVAGRNYSAEPDAQRTSREIPPCMAMGEAVGIAAAMALESDLPVRKVDVPTLQRKLRERGADPGDVPSANALVDEGQVQVR